MKAFLDASGKLTVKAESPVEQFALRHWWQRWESPEKSVILRIDYGGDYKRIRNPEAGVKSSREHPHYASSRGDLHKEVKEAWQRDPFATTIPAT